jgi:predicted enzyme related to lactoylglutathione lyase
MTNPVIHFEIQAEDPARASAFYKNAFGWEISQMMSADKGGMDYWGLVTRKEGTPGINGGMYRRDPARKITTFDCTIQVQDIDKAIADIKKNGGSVEGEKGEIPHVGWFIRAKDTEGNLFGVMQPTEWQVK